MRSPTPLQRWTAFAAYFLCASLSGLGLLGKTDLLAKASHLPISVLHVVAYGLIAFPLLGWPLLKLRKYVTPIFLFGILAGATIGFSMFQKLHDQGRGTDQPDCVIVAGKNLLKGNWPYNLAEMWSHNRMSCGPGWVALQAPVVTFIGYSACLILLWTASLWALRRYLGWSRTCGIVTLMGCSAGFWLGAANGTDFLTFGIATAALTVVSLYEKRLIWLQVILAGLVAQFRFPSILLPVFMNRERATKAGLWASLIAIACQAVFLTWDAYSYVEDGPLFVVSRFLRQDLANSIDLISIAILFGIIFVALGVSVLFARRLGGIAMTLGYLMLILFPAAAQNFTDKINLTPDLTSLLGVWEGGMWIVGCLPLAALAFVLALDGAPAVEELRVDPGLEVQTAA